MVTKKQTEPKNFEIALEELEQLVEQMESGELPLDGLLDRYQRGAQLIAYCKSKLEVAQKQIAVWDGKELKPTEDIDTLSDQDTK